MHEVIDVSTCQITVQLHHYMKHVKLWQSTITSTSLSLSLTLATHTHAHTHQSTVQLRAEIWWGERVHDSNRRIHIWGRRLNQKWVLQAMRSISKVILLNEIWSFNLRAEVWIIRSLNFSLTKISLFMVISFITYISRNFLGEYYLIPSVFRILLYRLITSTFKMIKY